MSTAEELSEALKQEHVNRQKRNQSLMDAAHALKCPCDISYCKEPQCVEDRERKKNESGSTSEGLVGDSGVEGVPPSTGGD